MINSFQTLSNSLGSWAAATAISQQEAKGGFAAATRMRLVAELLTVRDLRPGGIGFGDETFNVAEPSALHVAIEV